MKIIELNAELPDPARSIAWEYCQEGGNDSYKRITVGDYDQPGLPKRLENVNALFKALTDLGVKSGETVLLHLWF